MPAKSPLQAALAANVRHVPSLAAANAPLSRGPSLIVPRLYLSNYTVAASAPELDKLGVTHIVCVLESPGLPDCPENITRLHVELRDNSNENILRHLEQTTAFIRGALEEGEDNVVLVHCLMGISRSATVVWAYLVATTSMGLDESLDYIISKRSLVCPNLGFRLQMETYAEKVCGKAVQSSQATPKTRVTRVVVQHAMRLRKWTSTKPAATINAQPKNVGDDDVKPS